MLESRHALQCAFPLHDVRAYVLPERVDSFLLTGPGQTGGGNKQPQRPQRQREINTEKKNSANKTHSTDLVPNASCCAAMSVNTPQSSPFAWRGQVSTSWRGQSSTPLKRPIPAASKKLATAAVAFLNSALRCLGSES